MSDRAEAFEQSLTPEEIAAPTYLEWSDETLARAVRELAKMMSDYKGGEGVSAVGAAAVLVDAAKNCNAKTLEVKGGGYVVTVKRVEEQ